MVVALAVDAEVQAGDDEGGEEDATDGDLFFVTSSEADVGEADVLRSSEGGVEVLDTAGAAVGIGHCLYQTNNKGAGEAGKEEEGREEEVASRGRGARHSESSRATEGRRERTAGAFGERVSGNA